MFRVSFCWRNIFGEETIVLGAEGKERRSKRFTPRKKDERGVMKINHFN
jgi:hypothetical protein